jgi:multiple sugar transport system permease protein
MIAAKKRGIGGLFIWIAVILAAAWAFSPFYWAIITSFKPPSVILSKPSLVPWLQFTPTFANWNNEYITRGKEIGGALKNSVIIAGGATIIAIILGTLAGYGLARFRFRRWKNRDMTLFFLSQRFLPPMATVIPFFLFMKTFRMLDTHWALILTNATFIMPFAVLILRDVFKEIPVEMEESAWVDGASKFGAFLRIGLPMAAPAIAVAAVICFSFAWNEFLFGLILTYQKAQPVTVIIAGVEHTQGIQFWFVATRLLAAIIPPAILALVAQRYVVRALTFGAVKG